MRILKSICIFIFAGAIFSGCTTIECGGKKDTDGTLTVLAQKKKGGVLSTVVDIGLGTVATVALPGLGGALLYGANKVIDNIDLTDLEKAAIIEQAKIEAENYVRQNSAKFCNDCSSGVCQAQATTHKIELIDEPQFFGDRAVWTVRFKFKYVATVSCAACEGDYCNTDSDTSRKAAPACKLNPGIEMLVIDENTRIPLEDVIEMISE